MQTEPLLHISTYVLIHILSYPRALDSWYNVFDIHSGSETRRKSFAKSWWTEENDGEGEILENKKIDCCVHVTHHYD
jgi:hypothetical protein